jgi:undecaprenyl-diphosphatase
MYNINQELFISINNYATTNHNIDFVMISFAKYAPYLFIGLLFYLWFTNRQNKALYAGYTTILGVTINSMIGLFYFHPRPFMDNLGVALLSHKAENSFPSDHTTFVISIAFMLLTFKQTRIIGVVASILALWCGVARIYCGVHYPFDILGSIVVAIVAVTIIKLLSSKLNGLNIFIISLYNKILGTIYDRDN